MALATIPVVVERGVLSRDFAAKITLKRLRYLLACPQGPEPDATGYKGFFYHFLDIETGRRVWKCELSTIDSAFLFAGALTVGAYFDRDTPNEVEIRQLADTLYRRADWNWARDGGATLTHGWRPESGFLPHRWQGYDEGLLLYILGLGSPTYPLPPESYRAYCATYQWKSIYGRELLYSGPLFTHQLSHLWIDFRGIRDEFMREHGCDYFENSRQATFVQQEYAVRNPGNFVGYGEHCWGFTACDGPGWARRVVGGVEREFFDYIARGAPFGPDDGTVAPWVVVASLPFAPEIVIPTLRNFARMDLGMTGKYGFKPSFNQSFAGAGQPDRLVGHAVSLRHRSRAGRADDRELPDRTASGTSWAAARRLSMGCGGRDSAAVGCNPHRDQNRERSQYNATCSRSASTSMGFRTSARGPMRRATCTSSSSPEMMITGVLASAGLRS